MTNNSIKFKLILIVEDRYTPSYHFTIDRAIAQANKAYDESDGFKQAEVFIYDGVRYNSIMILESGESWKRKSWK